MPVVIVYNVHPATGVRGAPAAPWWTSAPLRDGGRRPLEQRRLRRAAAVRRRVTREHGRPLGALHNAYAETESQAVLLLLEEVRRPVRGRLRVQLLGCPRSAVLQHWFWLVTRASAVQRDVGLKRGVEVVLSGGRCVVHALVRRPCVLYHVRVPGAQGAHATATAAADHSAATATEKPDVSYTDVRGAGRANPCSNAPSHDTAAPLAHAAVHRVTFVL